MEKDCGKTCGGNKMKYPHLEKETFFNSVEFRIKIKSKYPKGIGRKGYYIEYLSRWLHFGNCGGWTPYVWIAYQPTFLQRIFGITFKEKINKQEKKCRIFLKSYLEKLSKRKTEVLK